MKVIKKIIEHMDDSLDEAYDYYMDYVLYKEEHPKYANLSLELARTHMDLYNRLHQVVVNSINDYKVTSGEPPKEMLVIWNYEHERLVEEYENLKSKINSAMR